MHVGGKTLVDFNRGGAPLAEIVTEPDFRSPQEAKEFLIQLRLMARYLGVSDADMEKGQLRCDANISLRPKSDKKLYPKTEVKNLNSFRSVERALQYEIERQTELWDKKQLAKNTETRGWDEAKQITVLQRTKEGSSDYRYFPEPDLPTLVISQAMMDEVLAKLVELPAAKQERFAKEYGLKSKDARVLVSQKEWAAWYESVMSELLVWVCQWQKVATESKEAEKLWQDHKVELARLTYAWITSELFKLLPTGFKLKNLKIKPVQMAEFISLIYLKKINSTAGQRILAEMFKGKEQDPSHLADQMNLTQIDDDTTLDGLVMKVLLMYPQQAEEYRQGKVALLKFFVGQVMKESRGKANPQRIEEILKDKLS
jgi:aspartyl-tRNA(Asn)/glutamyl-tRNA(Gln) amidotransferase subunit B